MQKGLAQQAINEALVGNWKEAVDLNKRILKQDSANIDALNRLARAYAEIGDIKNAKKTTKLVLKIDPFNPIAKKASGKWKSIRSGDTFSSFTSSARMFLEEPGKTKIVSLLHLGSSGVIAKLDSGDEVRIAPHAHRVSINTMNGKYIGILPDDVSMRLRKLIKLGNKYKVVIKSADENCVRIFIRETERSSRIPDYPSFSPEKIKYISFTPPERVYKKRDVVTEAKDE
jgi:tetratricopeptide (TPR) repeat protein